MLKHICDFCKEESEMVKSGQGDPKGWKQMRVSIAFSRTFSYNACPKCAAKLGINSDSQQTTSERVMDALSDMMEEIAEDVSSK